MWPMRKRMARTGACRGTRRDRGSADPARPLQSHRATFRRAPGALGSRAPPSRHGAGCSTTCARAADPAPQLVQLREAEAIGVDDEHDRCVGHVDADFDHRGSHEDVDLAALEALHGLFLLVRFHASVQHGHTPVGEALGRRGESLRQRLRLVFSDSSMIG